MAPRRQGAKPDFIPRAVRERLLEALDGLPRRPDFFPQPFAQSLDSLAAVWEEPSAANPPDSARFSPRARLLYYALVCQCLWRRANGNRPLDLSRWLIPGLELELAWIEDLGLRVSPGELESAVDRWWREQALLPPTDVLRSVYEAIVPPRARRRGGEVYTPDWLADHLFDILWEEGQTWLDPAVGSGSFLLALARKQARVRVPDSSKLTFVGFEANPWGVLAALANAAVADAYLGAARGWDARVGYLDVVGQPAPSALRGRFTRVIGNPPWVVWDQLDRAFVRSSQALWEHYGLWAESGMGSILGGGKKDLAMLVTYVAADRYLKPGGRLGLVITRSCLKSVKSGRGFRRWQLPGGEPLGVFRTDDLTAARPFPGTGTQAAALFLEKGKATTYPVPYYIWPSRGNRPAHGEVGVVVEAQAFPARDDDPLSAWRHEVAIRNQDRATALGQSAYRAHLGVNTGGANGVFWFERLEIMPEGLWRMRNLVDSGKRAIEAGQWLLESEFLYPVLRGKDVRRWVAQPSAWVLLAQDPQRRRGRDEAVLAERAARTLDYLKHFEQELRERAAFRRYFTRPQPGGQPAVTGPFYSMFNVAEYTLASIKVVWNRMGHTLAAAVVTQFEHKPILPQETHCFFAAQSLDEAHYLASLLNSPLAQRALEATGARGGKGFATPSVIHGLDLLPFDPSNPLHRELASFGEQASRGATWEGTGALEALTESYWRGDRSQRG